MNLVGSNTFFPKISKSIHSVLLPVIGSFVSSRSYVIFNNSDLQPLYNKVMWTPSFYDKKTQNQITELVDSLNSENNGHVYDNTWSLMTESTDPEYGRAMTLTNMLCNEYNKTAVIPVTEVDFYDHHMIPYKTTDLMDGTGVQCLNFFQNTRESLALTVVNTYNPAYQVGRNVHNTYLNTLNLGFQNNNDFRVILVDSDKVRMCYVDCKHQSKESMSFILNKLYGKDISIEIIKGSKFYFGCNIYMIGNYDSTFILSAKEKDVFLNFLFFIAKENPSFFQNFFDSEEFINFEKTGNVSVFKTSKNPVPKLISSREDLKNIKPIVKYESLYDRIKESVNENKQIKAPNLEISISDDTE